MEPKIIKLPLIKLYPYQAEVYQKVVNEGCKRAICCFHRRAGKSIMALSILTALALKERGNYAYCLPSYRQCKKVIWESIGNDGRSVLSMCIPTELIVKKNDSSMSVLLANGSTIQMIGLNNVDTIVGSNYKGLVFDEFALTDPRAWLYIKPILKVNSGTAIFISTPRSRNHFYDLWTSAQNDISWFCSLKTYKDTGILTDEDIDEERKEMSESLIQQEYLCNFNVENDGSYYGQEINNMRKNGFITDFPIDYNIPVFTSWDLGISDSSAIIFYQRINGWIHVIDCIESNNTSLYEYVKQIKSKPYIYDLHYLPHDGNQRELTTGESRVSMLRDMGLNCQIIPAKSIAYGIECVHRILSRCKIHETNCKKLIRALELYTRVFDEKNNCYLDKPLHNDASHLADGFRVLGMAERDFQNAEQAALMNNEPNTYYNPFSNW